MQSHDTGKYLVMERGAGTKPWSTRRLQEKIEQVHGVFRWVLRVNFFYWGFTGIEGKHAVVLEDMSFPGEQGNSEQFIQVVGNITPTERERSDNQKAHIKRVIIWESYYHHKGNNNQPECRNVHWPFIPERWSANGKQACRQHSGAEVDPPTDRTANQSTAQTPP